MEAAIVLGAGAVAVALANEPDPTAVQWWLARVDGAVRIENRRWSEGGE